MMQILVYGAGAIGGYLGSRLLDSGHQVIMLDRPSMVEGINNEGITVEEAGEEIHVKPKAVSSLAEAYAISDAYDLIIMGLKSYDLPAALNDLAAHDPAAATILTVQNGIGIEQPFIDVFGDGRILAGSLTTPVSKKDSFHLIVQRSDRGLGLAPTRPDLGINQWVTLFSEAGIETIGLADYESMKWSKAFLNIVSNATSAILDMTPGAVYSDPDLFDLEVAMLRETVAVMAGRNLPVVNLPGSPARSLALAVQYAPRFLLKPILTKIVAGGRGDKMPSFYIDLVSGRGKSEVVYHNGAIAAAGEAIRVPAPTNRVLNDTLLKLTNGELSRQEFAGNPQRLLSELNED
jgi:2-dehydropantoate 2-reductase